MVLPYLTFVVVSNNELGSSLTLRNTGIGPALIEDVRIRYKGEEIETDPIDFYVVSRDGASAFGLNTDKVQRGRLIPAGEWVGMLGAEGRLTLRRPSASNC